MISGKFIPLGQTCAILSNRGRKTPPYHKMGGGNNEVPVISADNISSDGRIEIDPNKMITEEYYSEWMKTELEKGDILLVSEGGSVSGELHWHGWSTDIAALRKQIRLGLGQRLFAIKPDHSIIDWRYLYYFLISPSGQFEILSRGTGTAALGIRLSELIKIPIPNKPLEVQKQIGFELNLFDEIIDEIDNIIDLLERFCELEFKSKFIHGLDQIDINGELYENNKIMRIDEISDVFIGKTPPRMEFEWFSNNPSDIPWMSIKDLGKCKVHIIDTNEYLTKKATERFNIKIIPENSVVLSFKLTVGRVAITDRKMTSNEAIAHFIPNKESIISVEYLYHYLKYFDYNSLGSTSSIANAINTKIIKGMPIIIPDEDLLKDFQMLVEPIIIQINNLDNEKRIYSDMRDMLVKHIFEEKN